MRHALNPTELDTVCVVLNYEQPDERVLTRSTAIIHVIQSLGGIWTVAGVGKIIPRPIRDMLYELVARNRYRVFGKYETCMLPESRHRAKFLDAV